jgi:transcriptional regulator with XRE-family HTH domain
MTTKKRKGPAPGTVYSDIKRTAIGTQIVSFRRQKGYSQSDLARKTGLSKRMISFYERECETIPVNKLQKIATALSVGLDELTNAKPNKTNLTIKKSFLKRLEKAKSLPPEKQKVVLDIIDQLSGSKVAAVAGS